MTDGLTWADEAPRSARFDDVYFSAEDGLAESRAVFLQGCGLPELWRDRRRFVVGELGFGTGLNVLALIQLWAAERPADARLHVFSVEAFPLSANEAARALARWPELEPYARPLLARWPAGSGFHRIDLPEFGCVLDVAHAEAADALRRWGGRADAWFLDGFAPSKNPQMWRDEVLALVAARSAPGARAATFTVAGSVRRGLEAHGFQVAKAPGYGRKRQRLEAQAPGEPARNRRAPILAVIGAGIAGAALARAFAAEGERVVLIAPDEPGASGNPAALVSPRYDAGEGPAARLLLQAWRRACALYTTVPDAVIARGLVQLEATPRDHGRYDKVVASPSFAAGEIERLSPTEAGERIGEPVAVGGLLLPDAPVVEPSRVIEAWLAPAERVRACASGLRRAEDAWEILGYDGAVLARAEVVCLAAGWGSSQLGASVLQPVRGQVSWAAAEPVPSLAVAWGGYAAPTRDGVLFGSTHDRRDASTDGRADDDARNLAGLAAVLPASAARLQGRALLHRASVRATTPDRLPLAGAAGEGLYILGGLGSRGFTSAPLLAEHVVALALGSPSPLPADLAALVDPVRYSRDGATARADCGFAC